MAPQPSTFVATTPGADTTQPLEELKNELRFVASQVARITQARAGLFLSDDFVPEQLHAVDKDLLAVQSRQDAILKLLMEERDRHKQPESKIARNEVTFADAEAPLGDGIGSERNPADVVKIEEPASIPTPGIAAAPLPEAKERHKHKYNKAKEDLELGAHGGMCMYGRHSCGAPSDTCSGYKFSFRCSYHSHTPPCPANGFINSDYSVTVSATHRPPTKDAAGAIIAGTGCERYSKFRGLHQSEKDVVGQHNVTAPSSTNAKAVSNKIAAKKEADKRTRDGASEGEIPFQKHTPSSRAIRYTVNKAKAYNSVDLGSLGDVQAFVEKVWSEKHKDHAHPLPCEVKVIHSESWESEAIPPKAHKVSKRAAVANPANADEESPSRTRKKSGATKEVAKQHNSILIFSTALLMTLCMGSTAASIDGTYRCAPARSTIADFGVFVGRAFVPCFLGILTGPRSGDTTEHWRRFLVAVKNALGGWGPQTCVRDHAACLINALNNVWGMCVQIVCYFHLRQCIRRRRSKMLPLANKYKEIMQFIEVLHYSTQENWTLARRVIDAKLPKVFKDYFFDKTFHGDGLVNEVWAHNLTQPGESLTNCAAEKFHSTLRSDPDMFNGVQKPAYMHAVGLLGNVIGAISFRCSVRSAVGGLLYTENADTTMGTLVRNTWKAALALNESGVLNETHSCARGTAFWFLAGGKAVTRAEVARLTSRKGMSASDYLAFFKLRRATVDACQCIPFLKWGFCRHVFAVNVHLNGYKFVPHGVLNHAVRAVAESDVDDREIGDRVENDASASESGPDSDEGPNVENEDIAPVATTQRSRRAAVVYNATDF